MVYVLHIPQKRKMGEKEGDDVFKTKTPPFFNHKKYSPRRWVVERTNS